jgi:hypothetical protein
MTGTEPALGAPRFRSIKEIQMADTVLLTDHEAIRDWVAARAGFPAVVDISPAGGTQPMLRLVFGQHAYEDQDRAERPVNAGGYDLVEWDRLFDLHKLGLVVAKDIPGVRDSFHEIVRRPD